ncbi:hypothetical protein [uncultured Tateyamaria sp.]|uniref:hypothetical protein n=1 Tax=uncultured Tateyamaria sp. TaxID=455651 RepID=UPI00260F07F0|nr:hypothetical protein [uncultured Tateyamaria sp.]
MFRLIYRQRRRHLFAAFFASLSCASYMVQSGFMHFDSLVVVNVLTILLTCMIVAFGTALVSALFVLIIPSWRVAVEFTAVIVFLNTALTSYLPYWVTDRSLDFVVWIGVYIVIFNIAYGTWLDRFRVWLDHSETRRFEVQGTAEELWDWLVPGLDRNGGTNWEPLLKKFEERADQDHVFDVEYRIGHAQFEHQTIQYEVVNYPQHARYIFQGELNPANRNLVSGTMEFRIEPVEGTDRCKVTLTRTRRAVLVREGLLMWFDDALGDQVDHMRAKWADRWDWSMTGKFRRQVAALS